MHWHASWWEVLIALIKRPKSPAAITVAAPIPLANELVRQTWKLTFWAKLSVTADNLSANYHSRVGVFTAGAPSSRIPHTLQPGLRWKPFHGRWLPALVSSLHFVNIILWIYWFTNFVSNISLAGLIPWKESAKTPLGTRASSFLICHYHLIQ